MKKISRGGLIMSDETNKIVEGTKEAGIYTNESGAYGVYFKGDNIGLFGSDISNARKILAEKQEKIQNKMHYTLKTVPNNVKKLSTKLQKIWVTSFNNAIKQKDNTEQEAFVSQKNDKMRLLDAILEKYDNETVLIFSRTKHGAKRIARDVRGMRHTATEIHSNRSQSQRKIALEGFKNGKFRVMVATDIAARGIDVKDIGLVINFDLPDSLEDYVHRIGRTARAGKEGVAITLVAPSQRGRVKRLEMAVKTKLQEIPVPSIETVINAKMSAVSDFIEQSKKEPEKKMSAVHNALNVVLEAFSPEEMKKTLLNSS